MIGAIRTGFEESKTEVVGIWVPHHVDPHGLVNKMYALVRDHDCQLVSGNRFNRIRRISRGMPLKKLLSRAGNWLLNRVIGVPLGDITTSVKLYRRSFVERHPLETEDTGGWALSTELAAKAAEQGYKMGEVEFLPENVNRLLH